MRVPHPHFAFRDIESWVCDGQTCWTWARENPRSAMVSIIVGLTFAICLYFVLTLVKESLVEDAFPGEPRVVGAPILYEAPNGGRALLLHMSYVDKGTCVRIGKWNLIRDAVDRNGKPTTIRHPLGSFQNGQEATVGEQDYWAQLSLPPDLGSGTWRLYLRNWYACPPLQLWQRVSVAPPITIDLGKPPVHELPY